MMKVEENINKSDSVHCINIDCVINFSAVGLNIVLYKPVHTRNRLTHISARYGNLQMIKLENIGLC
jgi:hypothetical protein